MKIVQGFEEKWNFPHTLGAIDGKHVMIKAPPHSGTDYFNYRRFFSVVFLGVVDSNRDKAFPLTHYCLRPFSGLTERGSVQRIFNMRHSIARRPVEMAYGIHSGRFRVLRKPIELSEENAKK
uniref:DDE Tnp4 domain-containing protein n=1 Tax=Anopheles quadriannulatus TaxID=34691 RepID=A0A182XQ44_ANOQN